MTPPAIGPAADAEPPPDDGLDVGWEPILVHIVTAQVSHPPPISEHISSEEQCGHNGGLVGQLAHLRKRVGFEKSASERIALALLAGYQVKVGLPKRP